MTECSNIENRIYSDLENEQGAYSNLEDDGGHHANGLRRDSDNGSQSGRSDHGSAKHGNDGDSHHDDEHSVNDRGGDRSDREDGQSDREDGRSDREDGRSGSHSAHDREGSSHDGDDGLRDQHVGLHDQDVGLHDRANGEYDDLEEANVYDELLAQAEAQEGIYNNAEQDRKSDDGHSDGEEGHRGTVRRESVEVVREDVRDEAIYDELERRSESEGSEEGEHARGHDRVSNDVYDNVDMKDEHTLEHGQERRGSHDSDEPEKRKSSDDEGIKRQTSSTVPASSGTFLLRTSRKADALHVLRRIRDSTSAEDNPEMDELVTILRSAGHESVDEDNLEEAKEKEKIKSFITSKLIHKFEQGIASEEVFDEDHYEHSIAESSKVSQSYNTTVGKTTVVKTTVKVEATSPVSPKSPSTPKSPSGPDIDMDISRSSSSSSISSSSQGHHKSVTYSSQLSKSSATAQGQQVNSSRHPSNELPKTPDEAGVPSWKADIEMRKKTKSHVPAQKPKEPMKMSEVPEWKKQLQEKNKMKKLPSCDEPDITLAKVTKLILNPSAASLPLKVEMGRLKHEMVINHGGRGDDLPEWARLADEKKKPISH